MPTNRTHLTTIQRAATILELLKESKSAGVADVAESMDLPKSTVHDYLATLESLGYIVNEGGEYRLGFRLLELGGRFKYQNRLYHVARPELERLSANTGELTSVNVEESGQFVILHAEDGTKALNLGIHPGMTTPLHTHAAGKVILANYSDEKVDRILDDRGLDSETDHTITSRETLFEEMEMIADNGYAVDWDEQVLGMGVVAAPVCTENTVVGSLGIVSPTDRLNDEEYRDELAREVQQAANVISVNYQYSI